MLYPIQSGPLHPRNHSPKLDFHDLQNQLLEKKNSLSSNTNLYKLPSLKRDRETSQKNIFNNELFKSILKKSVSLDLSEEINKKKQRSKSKKNKDALDEVKAQKNKFEHYRKYIESMSHENIQSNAKIHSYSAIKTIEPRKSQMPYIRVEKKQFHSKSRAHKYNSIVYDEAFVRIKSPRRISIKVQTSRSQLNQTKNYSTLQQQQKYNSPYKQQSTIRKLSHPPIKTKKRKILLQIMRGQDGTETDMFFTPWQNPETEISHKQDQG